MTIDEGAGSHLKMYGEATTVSTADAVIVGAGIIGAAVAYELTKLGYKTVNVDPLPAAGYGPTSNSCAIVRFHYSSWEGAAAAYESSFYWTNWREYVATVDELGWPRYVDDGVLLLRSKNGLADKCIHHYKNLGIPYEEWTTADLVRSFPAVDPREFWPPRRPDDPRFEDEPRRELAGAVFTPTAGFVDQPQLATHNLQRAAEAGGGAFRFGRAVVDIRLRPDGASVAGVVLDNRQLIDAPIVVNAAGPHSALVNHIAHATEDMKIGTRCLRHEVHHVPRPPGFSFERHGCVVSDGDLGIYYRPDVGDHLLVGSEDPPCDRRVWIADPDDYERSVTEAQWEAHVYRLAKRFPSLRIPPHRRGIVDLYDVSDDWMPIYDRSAVGGYYMAIGTSGHQFKTAPVVGRLMAGLIDAVENGHDHARSPFKLRCSNIDEVLDAGFYSRHRDRVTSVSQGVTA